ncbi:GntR family transcriptional regulator [Mycolicibacterium austroafricanum]|jgi:DNA-binding GntR family transcriptional regulator|uniref:GntR family transcriptional regulator n=1 Tax=Mycolicibacterium austroafricanum TaxID=39687 RepID=A0ABT8H719_MYCAO|nr:GntR family transcriptional regulator [Mycolicibacterium austroafricanum]MDN4516556.1 GntR family transcriptional regulator [Mycolicibacterium austroafricanum]QRZ07201.1 GntR family transcriptional regulator [Mycolicibacterium austroafricanum]QZT68686.1 GntR family transcriptional regulator [Mycolicibacterium austroafricanum]
MSDRAILQPIAVPRSLSEDAADRIREQIVLGGFSQGEHLKEARIAEQLNVSRGPVREAFKILRAEGLLAEEPHRGTFVVSLTANDVRDIYQVRASIEELAVRLVCREHDPEALAALRTLVTGISEAAATGDASAVARADLAFHNGLCELSGNSRVHEVFLRYVPTIRGLLRLDERIMPSLDQVARQHEPIVDAIESGDEELAGRLAREHSLEAGRLLVALLDESA